MGETWAILLSQRISRLREDRDAAVENALGFCGRAVKVDPTEWEGQTQLAMTMIFGTKAFEPARFHALEAVRLYPSAPYARHGCGCVLEWSGEIETALLHLRAIFWLEPQLSDSGGGRLRHNHL